MSSSPPECIVSGALALMLRASRLAGIAPVQMTRMPNGWRVSESPAMCVYSVLLLLWLHAAILTGLVLDYGLELEHSVRVRALTASVAWITELIVLFATTTIAVFGAPGRMTAFIDYMSVLHKLHLKMKIDQSYTIAERRRCIFIILYMIVVNLLQAGDWYCYIAEAVNEDRELKVVCLYLSFYFQFFITVVMKLQFIFIALSIQSTLKSINDALDSLIYIIDLYRTPFSVTLQGESVNDLLDFGHIKSNPEIQASYRTKGICETIRHLSLSYGSICDIIDQVNKNYGKVLLPIIVSLCLHLIITPYYLVAFIYSTRVRTINIVLEYFYFILHCSFLLLVIEPGHMTEKEMRRTTTLVSQLLRRISSPHDDLATELDAFYKKIALSKVSYSPMGMCTIARPLITAMSGSVTTYLVILLQLQTLDKPNW